MRITSLFIGLWFAIVVQDYGQTTIVIQPGPVDGKDSYVNSEIPYEPGGDKPELVACGWTFQGSFGIGRSLMRFDLSQIPTSAQILDAKLTLYYNEETTFGAQTGANASYLEKITEDWDEMTTTWNTMPPSTSVGAVFIPQTIYPYQDITGIDITGFVSGWVLNPATNFGMLHHLISEVEYNCVVYHSSDYTVPSKRPKLVVTYNCDLPVPHFTFSIDESMVTFSDSSFQPTSWYWDFDDGFYSDLRNPQHYFNKSGTYYVCEKVTNACDEQTYCDSVTVIAASVNNNTNYYYLDVCPNPAHDNIMVSVNVRKEGLMTIDLFNPQMIKMYSFIKEIVPGENKIQLNIPGLPAGLYFLRTESGENKNLIKLIIN